MSSREKILDCATEMFYQVGYCSTSVEDILKRCGVAKSNFYYHFESKEQLAFEVLDRWLASLEADMIRTLNCADRRPRERMQMFLEQVCRSQADYANMAGCPFGNFAASLPVSECDAKNERFRTRLSELFERIESALAQCVEDGSKSGEFRSDIPPEQIAALIFAALQGMFIVTKTRRSVDGLRTGCGHLYTMIRAC
jgi:TetR/AcrR family transcriptional repressor of nem operon